MGSAAVTTLVPARYEVLCCNISLPVDAIVRSPLTAVKTPSSLACSWIAHCINPRVLGPAITPDMAYLNIAIRSAISRAVNRLVLRFSAILVSPC